MQLSITRAVPHGTNRALVVADMPFLTYQVSAEHAMENAGRLFQEGGAAAVKIEDGRSVAHLVQRLTSAGLPVMGHLGLTPQHVHRLGGMRRQARDKQAAEELIQDAHSHSIGDRRDLNWEISRNAKSRHHLRKQPPGLIFGHRAVKVVLNCRLWKQWLCTLNFFGGKLLFIPR
jgi:hypothetical protein